MKINEEIGRYTGKQINKQIRRTWNKVIPNFQQISLSIVYGDIIFNTDTIFTFPFSYLSHIYPT